MFRFESSKQPNKTNTNLLYRIYYCWIHNNRVCSLCSVHTRYTYACYIRYTSRHTYITREREQRQRHTWACLRWQFSRPSVPCALAAWHTCSFYWATNIYTIQNITSIHFYRCRYILFSFWFHCSCTRLTLQTICALEWRKWSHRALFRIHNIFLFLFVRLCNQAELRETK